MKCIICGSEYTPKRKDCCTCNKKTCKTRRATILAKKRNLLMYNQSEISRKDIEFLRLQKINSRDHLAKKFIKSMGFTGKIISIPITQK